MVERRDREGEERPRWYLSLPPFTQSSSSFSLLYILEVHVISWGGRGGIKEMGISPLKKKLRTTCVVSTCLNLLHSAKFDQYMQAGYGHNCSADVLMLIFPSHLGFLLHSQEYRRTS